MPNNQDPQIITTPLDEQMARSLKAGRRMFINGPILMGRDTVLNRLVHHLKETGQLPLRIDGKPLILTRQLIYYAGPSETRPGQVIGSVGPTTSGRMDEATERLILSANLGGTIGKGPRSRQLLSKIETFDCPYFMAIGGAGALYAQCVRSQKIILYPELGAEALRELVVEDFPVFVAIDCNGFYLPGMIAE